MGKTNAKREVESGCMTFERLHELLDKAERLESASTLNPGMNRAQAREILRGGIVGRAGKVEPLHYSAARGRMVPSRDSLIAVNILREFA